jgi:hypothetical protein
LQGETDLACGSVAAEALAALLGARPAGAEEAEEWQGLCEEMVRTSVRRASPGSYASSLPLMALSVHVFAGTGAVALDWLWRVAEEALRYA